MGPGFIFWSFIPIDVSLLPAGGGLGVISLSNSDVNHTEIEMGRGPRNSWLNNYGGQCSTTSFFYSFWIQIMVF